MRLTSYSYSPSLTLNPCYSVSKVSYYPALPPDQVTFGAKKRWVRGTAAALALATTAAYVTTGTVTAMDHIKGCASTGKVVVTHTDRPWPKNINILTSSMPNQLSYFNSSGSFYVNNLIHLKQGQCKKP